MSGFAPVSKIDIETLVKTSLPPSPDNLMRISGLLNDINAPARKITEAITYEPMLVTRILRLVNSTIYGLERNVTSIQTAISIIGNGILHEIVLMEMASSTFAKQIGSSFTARKIWEHSLAVGMLCREIAKHLNLKGTEEAFTCGLLHDIGKMLLLSYDFEGFPLLQGENDEEKMLDCERRHYGYDHAELGSIVARHWDLHEDICHSIEFHHNPSMAQRAAIITHIVKVADMLANIKAYGLRREENEAFITCESVIKFNLTEEDLEIIWERAEGKVKEAIYSYS